MKTGLIVCFTEKAIDGGFLIKLYNKYVKFVPYAFNKKYKTEIWNEKKHIGVIEKSKPGESISVYDLNSNIFRSSTAGVHIPFANLNIEQNMESFLPSEKEVEGIIQHTGFVSAYLFDSEYVEIQSTVYINNLDGRGFGQHLYDTLKDTPYKIGLFDHMNYDIRYNPGRQDLISCTWLLACWKMWFGKPFFDLVPKEKMLSFKGAYNIKELQNGNVYVQLFEKIDESHTYENMRLQQKWRDEMGYNELISKYS